MKYISLFAGIGGFEYALNSLGNECVYANEWDEYSAEIYEKNFGHQPDTRDIKTVSESEIPDHDLLVGGFPCQTFSYAGKRAGFTDTTRGTLFFDIARIAKHKRPTYLLLENVKGLLSHDNNRTFQTILWTLDELGYELQWQVLNSKDYGVPQNRERVFIVGHIRGTSRPKIFPIGENEELPDREDAAESRQTQAYYSHTLRGANVKADQSFIAQRVPLKFLNRNQRNIEGDYAYTLDAANTGGVLINKGELKKGGKNANALDANYWKGFDNHGQRTGVYQIPRGKNEGGMHKEAPTLSGSKWEYNNLLAKDVIIRRFTPTECERLQGFPDNWTEGVSDSQRYKQLGNAVTTNVIYEIVKRLML